MLSDSLKGLVREAEAHGRMSNALWPRKSKLLIDAYCSRCRQETTNEAVWVGRLLKGRRCAECGLVMKPSRRLLAKCYLEELEDRVVEEAQKLRKTYGHNWRRLSLMVPSRLVSNSLKELLYVSELFRAEETWRQ